MKPIMEGRNFSLFLITCFVSWIQTSEQNEVLDLSICSRGISSGSGSRSTIETKSLSNVDLKGRIYILSNRSIPTGPISCTLELTACAVCQLVISWQDALEALGRDQQPDCFVSEKLARGDRCAQVIFEEEAADDIAGPPWRTVSMFDVFNNHFEKGNFTSSGYKLKIKFTMTMTKENRALNRLFPLNLTVVDNAVVRRGKPSSDLASLEVSQGYISSPRYPHAYPDGVQVNYTLVNEEGGPVRLVFEDFQLHYMSVLKILNSDDRMLLNTQGQFGGSEGRPSAYQSTGDRLTLIFSGNHYTHEVGFRAKYHFVKENSYWHEQPVSQSCDAVFESGGGTISIPSINIDVNAYIDCLWILGKSRYASKLYDKLYVKVEDFKVQSNSKGIRLQIREGRTSVSKKILDVFGPKSSQELARDQPLEGFIVDLRDNDRVPKGFYVRLQGYLASYSGLTISFSQFYRWATAMCNDDENEFHCDNGRCIKSDLRCDRRDHCGDFSDEKGGRCSQGGGPGKTGGSLTGVKANSSRTPLSNTLILVAALIGLALVMVLLAMVVARIYRRGLLRRLRHEASVADNTATRTNADEQTDPRAGPSLQRMGDRRFYMMPETEVGIFEAPPTYDDALKHPAVPNGVGRRPLSSQEAPERAGAYENNAYRRDSETLRMSAPAGLVVSATDTSGDEEGARPPSVASSGSSSGSSDSLPSSVATDDQTAHTSRISDIFKWARERVGSHSGAPDTVPETQETPSEQEDQEDELKSTSTEENSDEPEPQIRLRPQGNETPSSVQYEETESQV